MNTRDEHDVRKAAIEDRMLAESENREELKRNLCLALGYSEARGEPPFPPLDANLLATAKTKMLTTDKLRGEFVRALTAQAPTLFIYHLDQLDWALTQSTEVQQARAILEAID